MSNEVTAPTVFLEHYTDKHRSQVLATVAWLNENKKRPTWLTKQIKCSGALISQILSGKYPSDPGEWLAKIVDATGRASERSRALQIPFVETSVMRLVQQACHRAHTTRSFAVISAFVGLGKTDSLREYARKHSNVIMVEADPEMSPGALLMEICDIAGIVVGIKGNKVSRGTTSDRFTAIVKTLRGTDSLIVVDEAETLQANSLHYLRRIRDKAGIGVVLAGTEYLTSLIKPEHGQFDQIRSRVNFWPETVTSLSRDDVTAITTAALGEVDDSVLKAAWAYSNGSARVLCEGLLPAMHDYGLKQGHALNAALVHAVAKDVLSLKPRRVA